MGDLKYRLQKWLRYASSGKGKLLGCQFVLGAFWIMVWNYGDSVAMWATIVFLFKPKGPFRRRGYKGRKSYRTYKPQSLQNALPSRILYF